MNVTCKYLGVALGIFSLLGLPACSGGSATSKSSTPPAIAQASSEQLADVLPTQKQISDAQTFTYLMANPTVTHFDTRQWLTSVERTELWEGGSPVDDQEIVDTVNERCAPYEEVTPGLLATQATNWSVASGERRNILIGQNEEDQIEGYSTVLETGSEAEATALFNRFKNQTTSCTKALQNLYGEHSDEYKLDAPRNDLDTNTTTLNGTFRNHPFSVKATQQDRFLIVTWFQTKVSQDADVIDPAATVHGIALENAESIKPANAT